MSIENLCFPNVTESFATKIFSRFPGGSLVALAENYRRKCDFDAWRDAVIYTDLAEGLDRLPNIDFVDGFSKTDEATHATTALTLVKALDSKTLQFFAYELFTAPHPMAVLSYDFSGESFMELSRTLASMGRSIFDQDAMLEYFERIAGMGAFSAWPSFPDWDVDGSMMMLFSSPKRTDEFAGWLRKEGAIEASNRDHAYSMAFDGLNNLAFYRANLVSELAMSGPIGS